MVAAREAFLGAGHFDVIAAAVAVACEAAAATAGEAAEATAGEAGCVVDVGAGTGFYLARALERLPDRAGIALDSSKFALRRAARAHPRIGAVACDAWRGLPLRDATAAVALSVFAPRDAAEIARILRPGGALVLVTPTGRHLAELIEPLGLLRVDERKDERVEASIGSMLRREAGDVCETRLLLGRDDVRALAGMGPSAHHLDSGELERRLAAVPDPVGVGASVTVSVFRRR
jgi:23S rRNA (guanine745-N1)-methyltransferase